MKILQRMHKALGHPRLVAVRAFSKGCRFFSEDSESYLRIYFTLNGGYRLNLGQPRTFNEKLNWMKLHYHNPLLPKLADKYAVKAFVSERIGAEYVVPCLGVWDSAGDIDFDSLPGRFVLKCTHDSGGVFVCKDRAAFDKAGAVRQIGRKLRRNYYPPLREWVYKDIPPRVLADQFMDDGHEGVLLDYKFWCFGGVPRYMYITVKNDDVFENFYDMDFNPVAIDHGFRRMEPEFEKPRSFDLMKELAARLSAGLPFVRVDFFEIGGKPYFGEFTFYDWGGMQPFGTYGQDLELGNLLSLPSDHVL